MDLPQLSRFLALASGVVTLSAACTLSFDLPEASDAAPILVDAEPEPDADPGFTACSTSYDPVSPNSMGAGGFEVDREGWTNATDFVLNTDEAILGLASLHLDQDAAVTKTAYRTFTLAGRNLYTISTWVKTTGVTNSGCRMHLQSRDAANATVGTISSAYASGSNGWTLLQATGNSKSEAVTLRVVLECTSGAGEAWFDNLWFLPGNGPICGNLSCELDENCLADCGEGDAPNALFIDGFNQAPMTDAWKTDISGTWAIDQSVAQQSGAAGMSYAKPVNALGASDYRVGAEMTRNSSDDQGTMGLSLRGSDTEPGYQCTWQPATATLSIVGNDSLASVVLSDALADANYSPDATFAMQAEVIGDQVQCCVHGVPGAQLTVTDSTFSVGEPGLLTDQVAADFDSFIVVAP